MSTSHKVLFVFISIITLGIFPLVVYLKGKNQKTSGQLSSSEKTVVNLQKLKKNLGGLKNIVGIEFTNKKVKVFIKERELVQTSQIKESHGVSGVFVTSGSVTIIVGNSAKKIAQDLSAE